MLRLPTINWLEAPPDREVIARRTMSPGAGAYELELPAPPDPGRIEFLVVGDSGDSEASGVHLSPQDAVAAQMVRDTCLPPNAGAASLVLHTGDLVYMTGERRLYDRNFRRPYADFLTPDSTIDRLVFRLPFLPVPGNHDYYDFAAWAGLLVRTPVLGAGLRAIARELFAFSLPEGGSGMGQTYMSAFVDGRPAPPSGPLRYVPGERTRLPNRYYRFRYGPVDFFALDSNTLDAPPPGTTGRVRAEAAQRVRELEQAASEIDERLRRDEAALDQWRAAEQERLAGDPARTAEIARRAAEVSGALERLEGAVASSTCEERRRLPARRAVAAAARGWSAAGSALRRAEVAAPASAALFRLRRAAEECCAALRAVESCLASLPEGEARRQLLVARDEVDRLLRVWREAAQPDPPADLCARLRAGAEAALDTQRELVRERLRARFTPADYDQAQFQWLEDSLARSENERPGAWRIVYLHCPLYTTITNHCERADVQGLRENLLSRLRGRVHLVLAGHSHAFEWLRSDLLPHTGLFVTGGGGQVSLRRSVVDPRRYRRYPRLYEALRAAGLVECAVAGKGPVSTDRHAGPLYHYLRIEATPDTLIVRPVGVRQLPHGYRREAPMPVYHAPELPALRARERPPWQSRLLEGVEIRRDQPPVPLWAE